tara:strand:+ start:262 stop:663 length:402 start_codon:yes stop_codon:yes gene_type:complete
MAGETDLNTLLATLQPVAEETEYRFCSVSPERFSQLPVRSVKGFFREAEGVTVIISAQDAQIYGIPGEGPFACITCHVHSSLEAVGLTAAMSAALTGQGISANVVAGFYHDHVFVASADAQRAVQCLSQLSQP